MSSNIQVQPRNIALDVIKGLCIILMVIGHSGAPRGLCQMIGTFNMPAFFIISGFLLKTRYLSDIKTFCSRKLLTIWWPFFKWTLIYIVLHNLMHALSLYSESYSLKEGAMHVVKGFFMISTEQLLGGFWFLTSLLFASMVSILYLRLTGISRKSLLWGIGGALAIACLLAIDGVPSVLYFNSLNFQATAFFLTGTLIATGNLHMQARRTPAVIAALCAITIGTFWVRGAMTRNDIFQIIPYYLTASIITWGLIVVFWPVSPAGGWKYIVKIGNRTLDILIFHFLAFKLVTWMRVVWHDLPVETMAEFPVIGFKDKSIPATDLHWILYTIVGIIIPLAISYGLDFTKQRLTRK